MKRLMGNMGREDVLLVFLSFQMSPVFASTSLRHNTVDVWEMCAYTEKTGWEIVLYTFYLIIWLHQTFKGAFHIAIQDYNLCTLGYRLFCYCQEKKKTGCTDLNPRGNTGLQKFAANLYIIIF